MARLNQFNAPSYGASLVSKKLMGCLQKLDVCDISQKTFAMLTSKTKSPSSTTCYLHLIRNYAFITGSPKKAGLSHGVSGGNERDVFDSECNERFFVSRMQ